MILDQEIDQLNQIVLKMGDQVKKNLLDAFTAYRSDSSEYLINDDIIDQFERLIEEMSLNLILKERLYARDLRLVSGILKMVADLERIGDHAEDIMELNIKYKGFGRVHYDDIDQMFEVAHTMVEDSIMSFIHHDIERANNVIERDNLVDALYLEVIAHIITEDDASRMSSSLAIYTTLVVKYVERIADHAVNIAEWAVYIINGFHKDRRIF
jgi:phosphate transport system protein